MKGSLEKFHDWTTVKENESFSKARVKQKVTEKKSPKQQVWTTVKENEDFSKTRVKHKLTEKKPYSSSTLKCLLLMVIVGVILVVVSVTMSNNASNNELRKSKTFLTSE